MLAELASLNSIVSEDCLKKTKVDGLEVKFWQRELLIERRTMIQSPAMNVSLVCLRDNQKLCAWNLIDPSLIR